MKINDVKDVKILLDAGFSKDDVLKIVNLSTVGGTDVPSGEPPVSSGQDPDPGHGESSSQEPEEPTPGITELNNTISELRETFTDLKNEISSINIMNSRINAESEKSADDLIAEIINPFDRSIKNNKE